MSEQPQFLLESFLLHSLSYLPILWHLISFLYSSPSDINDGEFNWYWLEWNMMASSLAQSVRATIDEATNDDQQ